MYQGIVVTLVDELLRHFIKDETDITRKRTKCQKWFTKVVNTQSSYNLHIQFYRKPRKNN